MKGRILSAIVVLAIVVVGIAVNVLLSAMKEPPAQIEAREIALQVEAVEVHPERVPVMMLGHGETRSLNVVTMSPEVSGRVVKIHPSLKVGGVIPADEVLFEIDSRDYEARVKDAAATADMGRQGVAILKSQFETDRQRFETFRRTRDLAKAEFDRLKELFEKDQVGTRSSVEMAERAYNAAADQADQMQQALSLYPARIQEAESALRAAEARGDIARIALQRTVVKAPFHARVRSVNLEENQFVAPGASVLTIADDSILEISVPLDSREARQWLRFKDEQPGLVDAWFRDVEPVPVEIRWTEDPAGHVWGGTMHRVEKFDDQTRTVTVAVRISGENARSRDADGLPLVQGMFCEVRIPGREIPSAYRIPAVAVAFDGTAYLSVEGRLKTVRLERALNVGEEAIITGGLNDGDIVISTRLVNPLENAALNIVQIRKSTDVPDAPPTGGGNSAQ